MKAFDFTFEEMSMNAWPALHTIISDGWIIRLSNTFGNRANSVNPIYPSKIKLLDKINYWNDFFSRHNYPNTFKLVGFEGFKPCDEHKPIDAELEKLGYRIIHETSEVAK